MGDNTEVKERGCVIVANGRFPSAELPLRLLKEAKTIIACDGAVKTLYEKGIHPDAIVGDLDSIRRSAQTLRRPNPPFRGPRDQRPLQIHPLRPCPRLSRSSHIRSYRIA